MTFVPRPLVPGDTIAVVAPAKFVSQERVLAGVTFLEQRGYRVVYTEHAMGRSGLFAATDEQRAADFMAAWHSDAAAIFCAAGGYGCMRLLPLISWHNLAQHPKWLVGYSDITALHNALGSYGLVTIHGPMLRQLARDDDNGHGQHALLRLLEGEPAGAVSITASCCTLGSGKAVGKLVGGNLSLLAATIGTPYEVDTRDAILLLEDVEEEPYRLDRMLTQLALANKLVAARGFAVGTFTDCHPSDWAPEVTAHDVITAHLEPLGKPVLYNLPIGHGTLNTAVLLGSTAILDADAGVLQFSATRGTFS